MADGFRIIGISTRTTNKGNQTQRDLEKLWEQFFSGNSSDKILNKISTEILAIQTDYKSDFTEDYTIIIGMPVSTLNEIPSELIGREFDADNFQKFVASGGMPNAVVNTWIEIQQRDKEMNRKHFYDFEVYGAILQNGENSEVEICIGIKK